MLSTKRHHRRLLSGDVSKSRAAIIRSRAHPHLLLNAKDVQQFVLAQMRKATAKGEWEDKQFYAAPMYNDMIAFVTASENTIAKMGGDMGPTTEIRVDDFEAGPQRTFEEISEYVMRLADPTFQDESFVHPLSGTLEEGKLSYDVTLKLSFTAVEGLYKSTGKPTVPLADMVNVVIAILNRLCEREDLREKYKGRVWMLKRMERVLVFCSHENFIEC
jgi:hypothetical protein